MIETIVFKIVALLAIEFGRKGIEDAAWEIQNKKHMNYVPKKRKNIWEVHSVWKLYICSK